jgi:hypothetical protein
MPLEVPAHVQNAPYTRNDVVVSPGTNWDFSRSAIPTDIVQIPDPEPVKAAVTTPPVAAPVAPREEGIPDTTAALTLLFANNNAVIAKAHRAELRALPKTPTWIVIAHADKTEADPIRFAKARARAVTTVLRTSGHKVSFVRAVPAAGDASGEVSKNRSVAVYPAPAQGD